MSLLSNTATLKEALDRFEADLDSRVTDGDQDDVRGWLMRTRVSFDSLDSILALRRRRVHEGLFTNGGNQDAGELDNVRELRESDAKVRQLLEIVKSQIIAVEIKSATDVEPRVERLPFDEIATLEITDRGIELVHWIREQESAVTSWFSETFMD